MPTREELIKAAEAKFERDSLVRKANEKWVAEQSGLKFSDFTDSLKVGVKEGLRTYDKYLAAPPRAGVGALLDGKGVKAAAGATWDQFFKQPETAPTPKEIALKAGVEDKPLSPMKQRAVIGSLLPFSGPLIQAFAPKVDEKLMNITKADVAGFGAGVGLDLTNVIPLTAATKTGAKLLREGALLASARHLRPTAKVAGNLGRQGVKNLATVALDSGAIKFGSKASKTAERLDDTRQAVGALLGDMREATKQTYKADDIVRSMRDQIVSPLEKSAGSRREAARVAEYVDDVKSAYGVQSNPEMLGQGSRPMTAVDVAKEKSLLQGKADYDIFNRRAKTPWNKALKDMASVYETAENGLVKEPGFQDAKEVYGLLQDAIPVASKTGGLVDGGTGLLGHVTDTSVNVLALDKLLKGDAKGIILPILRQLTKGRVSASTAKTLDFLSKLGGKAETWPEIGNRIIKPTAQDLVPRIGNALERRIQFKEVAKDDEKKRK